MYRRVIVILFLFYCISTVSADEAVIHFYRDKYATRTIIVKSTGPLYYSGNTVYTTQRSVEIVLKTENISNVPKDIAGSSPTTYTLINEHSVTDSGSSYQIYPWSSGGIITLNAGTLNAGKMYSIKYSYGLRKATTTWRPDPGSQVGGVNVTTSTIDSAHTGDITLVVVQDIAGAGITIP